MAGLLGDRYLRVGMPRPVREFEVIRELEARGIPTAPAVGAAVYSAGLFYRGDLVTEWVQDSRDLAAVLFGADQLNEPIQEERAPGPSPGPTPEAAGAAIDPIAALSAAGRLVRTLHEAGVLHPDLNIKNILVVPGEDRPEALVVDLDRARVVAGSLSARARRRMVDRFHRSLRKWAGRSGGSPRREWLEAFGQGVEAGSR